MIRRIKAALEILKAPLLPYVFLNFKRVSTRTLLVAGTPPQSKRRTTKYEKEQKKWHVNLGWMAK